METVNNSDSNNNTHSTEESLLTAVRNQVEYYFSKENLRNDAYLVSQMDAHNSVPLSIVMKFAKLSALTQDEAIVQKALETSNSVTFQDGRLRPIIKSGRSTIILREIPSDAPEDEVKEIFSYPGAKPIISIKSEIGDTWFITVESEEVAKDTILDLKLKKRTFRGGPVKARLKTEAAVKSFFPTTKVIPPPNFIPMGYPGFIPEMGYGYPNVVMPPMGVADHQDHNDSPRGNHRQDESPKNNAPDGRRRDDNTFNKGGRGDSRDRRHNNNDRQNKPSSGRGGGRDGGHDRKGVSKREFKESQPRIELNAMNFPPLPHEEGNTSNSTSQSQQPYQPYNANDPNIKPVKHTVDEIINIVKNIKDAPLPETIKPGEHPLVMSTTPNVDLLLRQRTFSIDETKEQLQLGRPVMKEAILETAVDYGSMMYGEDHESSTAAKAEAAPQATKAPSSWAGVLMKSTASPAKPASENSQNKPTPKPAVEKKPVEKEAPAAVTPTVAANATNTQSTESGESNADTKTKSEKDTVTKKGEKKEKDRNQSKKGKGEKGGDDAAKAKVAESWGGRPTFANILKQQEQAQANEVQGKPAATSPTTPAPQQQSSNNNKKSDNHPASSSQQKGGHHKEHKSSHQQNKDSHNNPASTGGAWTKMKLPEKGSNNDK